MSLRTSSASSQVAAPRTEQCRILTGRDPLRYGVDVAMAVVGPSCAATAGDPHSDTAPDGGVLLAAPLLAVVDVKASQLIAVGRTKVVVSREGSASVTVVVHELWQASRAPGKRAASPDDDSNARGWRTIDGHPELEAGMRSALSRVGHLVPHHAEWRAVAIAKGLSEQSNLSVSTLRSLRYRAERSLGRRLRGTGSDDLDVLADVVELGIAANRARDFGREAAREGLWLWRTDKDAYHAHRRQADPSLPARDSATDGLAREWIATYDAGVRHCREMVSTLGDEVEQFHRLLEAGSTISVARDAKAQEHFNFVATVGAVVLGLPSLVLAVYGADGAAKLSRLTWAAPLIFCGCVSAVLAVILPTSSKRERLKRGGWALVAVLIALGMLFYAVHNMKAA